MELTLGILSWGAHKTLVNTLKSYRDSGLDIFPKQKIIFFQEMSATDAEIARSFGYEYIGAPDNIGIAEGYKRLVEESTSDLFLFLENDWLLVETDSYTWMPRLVAGMTLLDIDVVDVVRYRHRHQHGFPLWSMQYNGTELSHPQYLLDSVHWRKDPDKDFPQYIDKLGADLYSTYASFANWTNNPTMFRTEWLRENIMPRISGDIEKNLQDWWSTKSAIVAQGEGLFTHYRID